MPDLPSDVTTNLQIVLRFIHLLAGLTWVGLLYFFNLVNVPFLAGLDASTKPKIFPALMSRALWWFRWGSVVTVFAGIWYWMQILGADARNARAQGIDPSSGKLAWSFLLIWFVVFAIAYALIMVAKVNGRVLAAVVTIAVLAASWLFLALNHQGWESNRLLSIGIGGGMGIVMMLNVWGIIWRRQKRLILWNRALAEQGAALPADAPVFARQAYLASRMNFWLSFPMLFFMAAASHYPMFGR